MYIYIYVYMLYNYGMIFYINPFFGWALNYSALSSGAQTLGTVYARAKRT